MTQCQEALRMKSGNSYQMGEIRKNQWREAKNSSENNLFWQQSDRIWEGQDCICQSWKDSAVIEEMFDYEETLVIPFRRAPYPHILRV